MILKICIFLIQLNMMRGEHPLLSAMKHAKYGPFGLVGLKDRLNGSLDYIENVLGHRIKFNESIHSFNNISYKYLTECDVKPLNKFLFTTTNFYDHNTYRKRFFQQKSREDMFTKKYEAKYARLRAASTKKITRHTAATNIFDSRMLMDNLLENYPDMVNHLVTQVPWPRKLWTGTYPPDEPKEHPNNTTPENWSLDLHEKFSEEDYKGPERRIDPGDSVSAYGLSLPKEKVHYADEYNSQLLPELERQWKIRGYIGNVKLSVDILMKDIMVNKRRARRQALTATAAAVTDYWGKVEDPLSNCCNNSASREAFRRGVQMVKMKKYKQHFDAIKPPTTKITTEKSKLEEERAARVRRGNLEDLYPSVKDSGASHNLEKYGIDEEKQGVRYTTTRFPTTRLIYPMSNPTKTKLIEDIEKRFSLKIEDLTTPYTLQWSPYNLIVTDPELLDSDSILEVMDFYEEREFPTQSTKLNTPIFNFGTTEPEPTLYDFDNMTPFNMENVRKIEKKFNVSLKDFENHPDNMRIVASTFGFGFVGLKDQIVNISHEDTLIDKMDPAMQAILPTEYGFWDPENKGKTVEYGRRDWVLKDLLAEWKKIHNDSIETMHRKAVNMTLERKKLECRKLGITWTEPKKFNKVSEALAQEFTGSTFHPNDEAVMEDHARHVEYVNNYNEKHSLWPTKCTEETYCPESEERQATIMDWILKDYTDLRLEHKKRVLNQQNNRPKREANSNTLQPAEDEEYLDVVGTAKDCYQTFDDPREFQKALQSIQGGNNTIEGRENFKKAFMEMQESTNQSADGIFIQHGTNRVKREVSEQTESWLKRFRRDMPYLGYSGLTSKIIFRWTNYPYYKTIAPSFLKRSRIHARHRPTHHDGEEVHIKRKQWTVDFTSEPYQQTLKYVHGIPVREKLDYDWHFKNEASSPRNKRDLGRVTAMDDYSASGKDSPSGSGPLNFRRTTEQSDDIQQSAGTEENDDSGRTSEATTTVLSSMFSNAHVATKHAILKRDLFTGSWNIIHQMTRTKSENIKNIERRFSVDIDKITTDQPFNMTLLLEMMSKLVHTYKLTLATLPTEPFVTPHPSLKYHTVYRREKRAVDRFMDYVADPVIQTLYGVEEVSPTTLLPHYRPETSTFWGSDTAWYHQTPDENDDTAWIYKPTGQYRREKRHMTEERRIPYIRANAYEERVTGHNFSYFMSMDPETAYIDRLKRSIRQNDLQKQPSLGLTESWLKRFRRDMPYLGYSGLTSKIIFRWTNYPYYKTIAPSFLKRSRIHARHRPTHHDGEEVHIKRKQWTVDFTSEPYQQTLKYIHGIPVREKLDYDWHFKNEASSPRNKRDLGRATAMDDYDTSGKDSPSEASGVVTGHVKAKRSVGTETNFNSITTNSTSTDRTAVSFSSTTTPSIAKPIISNLRIASGNSTVNETARVIGTVIGNNTTVTSSTNAPSTTDIGSQNPGANIINPVQTLGRKKRAVPAQRRSGKDLFEKIIMAYYNCKNVWKEPHSPEILQIRHRYREQKKRQFSRVFGRRKHEHVDIYYD